MAENQSSQAHAKQSKAADSRGPVPPTHVVIDPPFPAPANDQPPEPAKTEAPEKPLPWFVRPEWVIVYITAIYVLFTWLTLRSIKRQADLMERQANDAITTSAEAKGLAQSTLKALERQAEQLARSVKVARITATAARKNADAVERSVQAFINKERARLFIRPSIEGNFKAVFHVENLGSSPALVYYGFVGCEIMRKDQDLPLPPNYTNGDPEWVFGRADWVTSNDSAWVGQYSADYIDETDNHDLYANVMSGLDVVWFYGIVRYEDIVSGKGEEIRFCYRWHSFPNGKSFLSEAGPTEYRDRYPYDKPN